MLSGLMKWIGRSLLWSGLRLPFCWSKIRAKNSPTLRCGPALEFKRAHKIVSTFRTGGNRNALSSRAEGKEIA
jgi:hypothetical protein